MTAPAVQELFDFYRRCERDPSYSAPGGRWKKGQGGSKPAVPSIQKPLKRLALGTANAAHLEDQSTDEGSSDHSQRGSSRTAFDTMFEAQDIDEHHNWHNDKGRGVPAPAHTLMPTKCSRAPRAVATQNVPPLLSTAPDAGRPGRSAPLLGPLPQLGPKFDPMSDSPFPGPALISQPNAGGVNVVELWATQPQVPMYPVGGNVEQARAGEMLVGYPCRMEIPPRVREQMQGVDDPRPPTPNDAPLKVYMASFECEVRQLDPRLPAKKRPPVW